MTLWTFRSDDDTQTFIACAHHSSGMVTDGDAVTAQPADDDCECTFCSAAFQRGMRAAARRARNESEGDIPVER